jgi:Zinc carboxypeptidase
MKKALLAVLAALAVVLPGAAGVDSLSRLFAPGQAVLDLDGDGFPEKPALAIIVPDRPTAAELALAADIAARVNFESLVVDFGLVRRESELAAGTAPAFQILVGGRLARVREALKGRRREAVAPGPNQGLVFLVSSPGQTAVACVAGSDDTLLKTGRAFFLRWPYFWEVWGRETGATYENLEKDLESFLEAAGVKLRKTVVREAFYEFPAAAPVSDGLQALSLDQGQIRDLAVEIHFASDADRRTAADALADLARDQRKGNRTALLSYPACAALTFELRYGESRSAVVLPRMGATRRLLTPTFKERPASDVAGKDFDLVGLFSSKAIYADQDRDGIPDGLDGTIVVPKDVAPAALPELAARFVLGTAGASFPVVELDSEIESRRSLAAPVLVGANALTSDLVKTGTLKLPDLPPGGGWIKVVPKAFGKSSAVAVAAADPSGLEKTLSYLARTFPYFDEYGEGRPQLSDLADDLDRFLAGGKGGAEAFIRTAADKAAAEIKGREIESVRAELVLPDGNPGFGEAVRATLGAAAGSAAVTVSVESMKAGRTIFEKEKTFTWEVDDARALLESRLPALVDAAGKGGGVKVSLGVSESPAVRAKVRSDLLKILGRAGFPSAEVEVLSAYKPGYFWLVERVLPALKGRGVAGLVIRFSEERPDFTRPQRTYGDPNRWLQELYPVDEPLAQGLGIALDRITFEAAAAGGPTYEVEAVDAKGAVLSKDGFTPPTREIALSSVLPEWGRAKVTTGWLRIVAGGTVVCDEALETDLEKFWTFYQDDVLRAVAAHVRKKTGGEPTFSKQPYFKRLLVDLKASEPDFRTGVDEEIVSSLEAIHDEIYFDTLDLLRGITRFDPEDKEAPADTSRSSAPGNVFPSLHPSLEGGPATVRAVLEDWPAPVPQAVITWKEKGHEEVSRKSVFPALKPKSMRATELFYDGRAARVTDVVFESEWEKEADYLAVIDMLGAWRGLSEAGLAKDPIRFPRLDGVTLRLKNQAREKDERLPVVAPAELSPPAVAGGTGSGGSLVPTKDIIPPALASDIVRRLSAFPGVRGYVGGKSYEGREVPVLEIYRPFGTYVSLPRLIAVKPTLQAVARQHANEVASTNYLLRFAEMLARDPEAAEALKKVNFVFQPVENPDGAALAYEMHKNEPFHSLHAGRYGALGVDMGSQTATKPLLPEAVVRPRLYERWLPDIVLNLHGYPSHEWVQPFSNYTPYLFRDYWIPKGWFAYVRSLRLPIFAEQREAGEALRKFIAAELNADARIAASNSKFYDRYERWAGRWSPHLAALEVADGVNIYAKRRGPTENRLTPRAQLTLGDETPELMDETATGDWLDFLGTQGLAYLRAHVKYLERTAFEVVRIEEEVRDRVRLTLVRGRPGRVPDPDR